MSLGVYFAPSGYNTILFSLYNIIHTFLMYMLFHEKYLTLPGSEDATECYENLRGRCEIHGQIGWS